MPKYKLIGNKIQIWDTRFDHYSDEALSFFSKLERLAGSPPPRTLTATQESIEWQDKRWNEFLKIEAEIINSLGLRADRMH